MADFYWLARGHYEPPTPLDERRHPGAHSYVELASQLVVPEPPAWTVDALCAQTDPEAFFPEKGGTTKPAKRTCAACSVQAVCLQYALDTGQRFGIWGGLSERERRRLKRDRRSAGDHRSDPVADEEAARLQQLGWTVREIADHLQTTERTVHRRIARHRDRQGAAA